MSRSRDPHRFERRLTLEHAIVFFLCLSLLASMALWTYCDANSSASSLGLLFSLTGMVACLLPGRTRIHRWAGIGVALSLVSLYASVVWRNDPFIIWPPIPLVLTFLYVVPIPIVIVARLMGWYPLKWVFVLTVLATGVTLWLSLRPRSVDVVYNVNQPPLVSALLSCPLGPEDKYSSTRESVISLYYPDDPRGEFTPERTSGRFDLRTLSLRVYPDSLAKRTSGISASLLRVVPERLDRQDSTKIHVYRFLNELVEGSQWRLRFRVRADASRRMHVCIQSVKPPIESIGLSEDVEITPAWKTFAFDVSMASTHRTAELRFTIGDGMIPVEWSMVSWEAIRVPREYPRIRYRVDHVINEEGYRSPSHAIKAESNVYRIAVLGDSMTFGQGVPEGCDYPRLLESELNKGKSPPSRYEVMNFGICGLDTQSERELYEKMVRKYDPDLVLLTMFKNDDEPAGNDPENREGYQSIPVSFMNRLGDSKAREGFKRCLRQLAVLKDRIHEDGSRLAVVLLRLDRDPAAIELFGLLEHMNKELNLPLFDSFPLVQHLRFEDIQVHAIDGHANGSTNRMVSAALAKWLIAERLVPESDR